jgi:hypothetical protein
VKRVTSARTMASRLSSGKVACVSIKRASAGSVNSSAAGVWASVTPSVKLSNNSSGNSKVSRLR